MINIKTQGLMDGQFTRLFKDLYIMTSDRKFKDVVNYPKELKPYLDGLYGAYDLKYEFGENKFPISTKGIKLDIHDTRVVCGVSGGKDSMANALILKSLGYEPILFTVKGLNRSYPNEYEYCCKMAEILGLELITYTLKVSGKCEFFENPTKDQFIMALMIDWGLQRNIPNYSLGTYVDAPLEVISKEYMLSDGSFMFDNLLDFYHAYFPEMDFPMFLYNSAEAYMTLVLEDVNLYKYVHSCMTPLRYKENLRKHTEEKYGIKALPNTCGCSCYKCADESLTLNALGAVHFPDEYLEHCKEVLYKFYAKYKPKDFVENMKTPQFQWVDEDMLADFEELKNPNKDYTFKY